jgi:hypothetical protein
MAFRRPERGRAFVPDSGPSAKRGLGAAADFQKLLANSQANGMQLFFTGKLKLQGN